MKTLEECTKCKWVGGGEVEDQGVYRGGYEGKRTVSTGDSGGGE